MTGSHDTNRATSSVRLISRWRWIILLVGVGLVFVMETLEHSALTPEYLFEFLVYGLAIAASTWVLLTVLSRQLTQQAHLQDSLHLQRQFSQQLARYQDRDELAQFIVGFPSASMPVDQVLLFQYDHLSAQLAFVAEWNSDGLARMPERITPLPAKMDYVRTLSKTPDLHDGAACPLFSAATGRLAGRCYCLPLVHDSILVGVLRLRCDPERQLLPVQMQFLNTLASQMALALALSIAFPQQLTEAQRIERRRLSYELHDSLAQQIGFLHLSLDRLATDQRIAEIDGMPAEIDRMREVAGESYQQVRDSLDLLRQQDALDLTQMVNSYIEALKPQVLFVIRLITVGTAQPLGLQLSQRIFRLIQESMNNVQKHAQAHTVEIKLAWHFSQLEVSVSDDGVGFDTTAASEVGHYGLTMLREQVQEMHGTMRLATAPNAGTTVTFSVPLPPV